MLMTLDGSNRTFMELKWRVRGRYVDDLGRSNRTFMELKSAIGGAVGLLTKF